MGLGPYLKFVAPGALALAVAVLHALITGELDKTELEILSVAFVTTNVAFVITNGTAGVARFAKAVAPAALTLVGIGIHGLITGDWGEREQIAIAATGLLSALVTWRVPNTQPGAPGRDPVTPEGSDRSAVADSPGQSLRTDAPSASDDPIQRYDLHRRSRGV